MQKQAKLWMPFAYCHIFSIELIRCALLRCFVKLWLFFGSHREPSCRGVKAGNLESWLWFDWSSGRCSVGTPFREGKTAHPNFSCKGLGRICVWNLRQSNVSEMYQWLKCIYLWPKTWTALWSAMVLWRHLALMFLKICKHTTTGPGFWMFGLVYVTVSCSFLSWKYV